MLTLVVTSRGVIMGVLNMLDYFYFPIFLLQYYFVIRKKSLKLASNERRKELTSREIWSGFYRLRNI